MANETTVNMTCIGCPLGCGLMLTHIDGEIIRVEGSSCKRGQKYARQEFTDPRRDFATTVLLHGAHIARVPVKTSAPVPKDMVVRAARACHRVELRPPVHVGQVVIENVLGTGVDILATREVIAE